MSNPYIIDTPENVSFGYDVAGIGSRFLATLIDSIIQGAMYLFIVIAFSLISYTGMLNSLPREITNLAWVFGLIAIFLIQFGYFLFFELFTGGLTPGKRLFGLRVIRENGYPLSPLDSIIRNLVRIIDFFPAGYGVGILVMFFNERAKRLGDFAAGTLVVKMRNEVRLSDLQATKPIVPYLAEMPGIENLREADIELVESFLQRHAELRDSGKLASTLARTIRTRIGTREAEEFALNTSHEEYLRQVAAAYRKLHQRS